MIQGVTDHYGEEEDFTALIYFIFFTVPLISNCIYLPLGHWIYIFFLLELSILNDPSV